MKEETSEFNPADRHPPGGPDMGAEGPQKDNSDVPP